MSGNQLQQTVSPRVDRHRHLHFALMLLLSVSPAAAHDGDYDTSWGNNATFGFYGDPAFGAYFNAVDQVVVESSGRLLSAGYESSGPYTYWYLRELLPNGTVSPTFGRSDGSGLIDECDLIAASCQPLSGSFSQVALQGDGRIVVLDGQFLARLTSGGHALDTASVSGGTGYVGYTTLLYNDVKGRMLYANAMQQLASGKWLLAGPGYYSQADIGTVNLGFAVIRLNSDFSLDTTFNAHVDGSGVTFAGGQYVTFEPDGFNEATVKQIGIQSDGSIVLVGNASNATTGRLAIARLNADGTLDTSYGGGTGKVFPDFAAYALSDIGLVRGATIDAADRALMAVEVRVVGYTTTGLGVLRLLPSGAPDTTFNVDGLAYYLPSLCASDTVIDFNAVSVAVTLDSAGRIVAAGTCELADNTEQWMVERIFGDDGSVDTSFANGGFGPGVFSYITYNWANDIVLDASGHPLISGYATDGGEYIPPYSAITRLTYDLVFTNNFERVPPGRLPGQ